MFVEYFIVEFLYQVYEKKNVDYFIYNYFLYIHKLSSNRGSNRKPNRTITLGLISLSNLNGLDQIAIFSNRCYRFGLNMMLKPIQTDQHPYSYNDFNNKTDLKKTG